MSQTRNQQAYQRGIWVARMWKRLKGTILRWDTFCVSKARKHKLPGWIGHVPIAVAFLGSAATALFGGIIIAGSLLFIWAIAIILQNINTSNENVFDDRGSGPSIRHGNDGYGYYTSSDDLTSERLD
ncbi:MULTISPECIES: hypothetical protein [unclassified Serratia (in: enterobacteria)]|uniref:hypothetical protein n=1 Tax=unclassified Serratia (in: enterobacteria) TaxID=2647522 RepID=UPI002ED669D3|nr:hypothetical protein [Serratia sp. C2(2)]MEE4449863.1 hypothetical protein [Serratia sp. C2(1)]